MNTYRKENIKNMLSRIMEYGFEVSYENITEDIDDFEARCVIFEEVDSGLDEEDEEEEENGYYYYITLTADRKMIMLSLDRENVSESYEIELVELQDIDTKIFSKEELQGIVKFYGEKIESFSYVAHGMGHL